MCGQVPGTVNPSRLYPLWTGTRGGLVDRVDAGDGADQSPDTVFAFLARGENEVTGFEPGKRLAFKVTGSVRTELSTRRLPRTAAPR